MKHVVSKELNYNSFICSECADKLCAKEVGQKGAYTVHASECEACGEKKVVTQVRDYGGMRKP